MAVSSMTTGDFFSLDLLAPQHFVKLCFVLLFVTSTGYLLALRIYNIYFHPLARFPGPRAAATSNKWLLKQSQAGCPEEVFEMLHQFYGTHALRIAPNELHISDTSLYTTIYSQTSPYRKHADFYGAFGMPHTLFVEDDLRLHKERRRMLNTYFSRSAILKMEPVLVERILSLLQRLEALQKTCSINMYNAARCVTVDIISQYAFGRSLELVRLSDEHLNGGFLETFDAVPGVIWDMAYHPTRRKILNMVPKSISRKLSSALHAILSLAEASDEMLKQYKADPVDATHPVLFDGLRDLPDNLLVPEAVDILVAGSDTTAFTVSIGVWHILSNSHIKDTLVSELTKAIPDKAKFPALLQLEEMPFLMACVRESIRVANAVPGRLPRVVPSSSKNPLMVDGIVVPPGTIVGISSYTMHHDQLLWGPDAAQFSPGRWLRPDAKSLEQSMVSFSKGARSCLGQNLATAELTLLMAYFFRNYDMKLKGGVGAPHIIDNFTSQVKEPGILVDLQPRKE